MHNDYSDITSRITEPPKWWDEHAVPRYCDFGPEKVANIYADEVALVEIACQNCGRRFQVAFVADLMRHLARGGSDKPYNRDNLAQAIRGGIIHYGDPPNTGCCPAGPTMRRAGGRASKPTRATAIRNGKRSRRSRKWRATRKGKAMSERTLTAAELAEDTDEAREVWAKVERGELAVTRTVAQGSLHVPARKELVPFLQSGEQLTITVTRLGKVLAERDALAAIVAAVEAEVAKLPGEKPNATIYVGGFQNTQLSSDLIRYEVRQRLERAIAEARNGNGD
jgi:hypothetical protein